MASASRMARGSGETVSGGWARAGSSGSTSTWVTTGTARRPARDSPSSSASAPPRPATPGVRRTTCQPVSARARAEPANAFTAAGCSAPHPIARTAVRAIPKWKVAGPERPEDRILNVFYGRVALRVDFMCEMGDLVPGTSGEALGRQVFGFVPESFVSRPSKRRYPVIAVKFPPMFLRVPSLIRRARAETRPWWAAEVARTPSLDLAGARAQLQAAIDRFTRNLTLQAIAITCGIQVVYEQL